MKSFAELREQLIQEMVKLEDIEHDLEVIGRGLGELVEALRLLEDAENQAEDDETDEEVEKPVGHDNLTVTVGDEYVEVRFSFAQAAPGCLRYSIEGGEDRFTAKELTSRWGSPTAPHVQRLRGLEPGTYTIRSQTLFNGEWVDVSPDETFTVEDEDEGRDTDDKPPIDPVLRWPEFSADPDVQAAGQKGTSRSFDYGGTPVSLLCLDDDSRPKYAKRASITPADDDTPAIVILNDESIYNLLTGDSIQASLGAGVRADWRVPGKAFWFSDYRLYSGNVLDGSSQQLCDYEDFFDAGVTLDFGAYEGNLDRTGTKGVVCDVMNNKVRERCVASDYDQDTHVAQKVTAILDDAEALYGGRFHEVNWISVDPSGNYVVASVDSNGGVSRYVLYDFPFESPRRIGDPYVRATHDSFGVGKKGEIVLSMVHWDDILYVPLENPERVCRAGWGAHGHLSGHPDLPYIVHSTEKGDSSLVRIGQYDADLYTGSPITQDSSYLGYTYEPIAPSVQRVVGRFENYGEGYPNSAQARLTVRGDQCLITGISKDQTSGYAMVASV